MYQLEEELSFRRFEKTFFFISLNKPQKKKDKKKHKQQKENWVQMLDYAINSLLPFFLTKIWIGSKSCESCESCESHEIESKHCWVVKKEEEDDDENGKFSFVTAWINSARLDSQLCIEHIWALTLNVTLFSFRKIFHLSPWNKKKKKDLQHIKKTPKKHTQKVQRRKIFSAHFYLHFIDFSLLHFPQNTEWNVECEKEANWILFC